MVFKPSAILKQRINSGPGGGERSEVTGKIQVMGKI
jgi:hypothetical protein